MTTASKWCAYVGGLVLAAWLCGCSKSEADAPAGRRAPTSFPVEVAPIEAQPVEYTLSAVGSVEAFEQVQITSRVAGVVEKVRFVEGQAVKQGEVLVEIEPSRFALAVRSAEAALERAVAAREEAESGLLRRQRVEEKSPGLIRGEELEAYRTKARAAAAEEKAARVALDKARLDLRDAYVRAPDDGVVQTRSVQTGQYVQVGTVLASMIRREPLLVRFKVPEPDAARLGPGMPVRFTVRNGARHFSARITHVADAAEESSRMVAVTAEVDDAERKRLRPGAFAEVVVQLGRSSGSPVLPQTAVRATERGFIAFVVEGNVAKERVLNLGLRTPDGKVEVRSGVKAGERVVVRGAEALRDGAAVRIANGEHPTPQKAAGGRP